ncbi:MAG: hypothetical protein GDA53_08690 [Rhodobacteraceae bacterium]|nr:hypothetical protein [Paracoccaceae bacterium]
MTKKKYIEAPKSHDFTFKDGDGQKSTTIGHLRVKPSGNLAWKGPGKQKYKQVSLEQFVKLCEDEGKEVTR